LTGLAASNQGRSRGAAPLMRPNGTSSNLFHEQSTTAIPLDTMRFISSLDTQFLPIGLNITPGKFCHFYIVVLGEKRKKMGENEKSCYLMIKFYSSPILPSLIEAL